MNTKKCVCHGLCLPFYLTLAPKSNLIYLGRTSKFRLAERETSDRLRIDRCMLPNVNK